MKYFIFFLFFSIKIYSQEIHFGLNIGVTTVSLEAIFFDSGVNLEFVTKDKDVSISSNIFFIISPEKIVTTIPLSISVVIGDKFRFLPSIGGFIRTSSNYGWLLGTSFEYNAYKNLHVFAKFEYYKDYRKVSHPDHFGGSYEVIDSYNLIRFSLGVKKVFTFGLDQNPRNKPVNLLFPFL